MLNTLSKACLILVVSGITLSSCYKKPDIENTSTVNMSGEWWAQYFADADPATPLTDYGALLTYNTTDNNTTQLWIEDHIWPFKSKVNINYGSMLFTETASAENLETTGTNVRILEGKVLKDAAKSQSGNVVDSIFLRVEFLDEDPGNIYQVRGHMKTGFFEDEF